MSQFAGKVALVTGATSGIGKAVAEALAAQGAKVVISGRREREGQEVVRGIEATGGSAVYKKSDASKEKDIVELVAFTVSHFSRLDLAVNNAGISLIKPTLEITEDDFRRVFDLNVWGVLAAIKHEIAAMLETGGGSIVNISSASGHRGYPGIQVYCGSKHAVEGITKAVALEFATQGIRVNAVAPAVIETEMSDSFAGDQAVKDMLLAVHPVGHFGNTGDVARAVLFLLDPANTFVTGTSLIVDGGSLA